MKFLIAPLFCCALMAQAQTADESTFGQEAAMPGVENRSPGKGVFIENRLIGDHRLNGMDGKTHRLDYHERSTYKLKIPVVLKDRFRLLLGVHYEQENYRFDDLGVSGENDPIINHLNQSTLRTSRFSAYLTKSIDQNHYAALKTEVVYSGDYDDLEDLGDRYADYRMSGVWGIKVSDQMEYGFGFFFSQNFRRTAFFPFAFYNRTFNDKWGLEFVIPVKLKARYNFNRRSLLLFGPEFESRNYALSSRDDEVEGSRSFFFRRSALTFAANYMYQVKGWVWLQAKAGFSNNLPVRLDDRQNNQTIRLQQGGSPFISVGLFLSPSGRR